VPVEALVEQSLQPLEGVALALLKRPYPLRAASRSSGSPSMIVFGSIGIASRVGDTAVPPGSPPGLSTFGQKSRLPIIADVTSSRAEMTQATVSVMNGDDH